MAIGGDGRPTPWTIYAYGGWRSGRLRPCRDTRQLQGDVDATLAGVTAGAEYRAGPAIRFGAAFDYAHSDANLESTIGARAGVDSFQGALYASATYPRLFLDGIVAGGSASLDQTRDGVFGSLHAAPRAGLLTATGRVGYLVPVGPVKLGPVRRPALHAHVDGRHHGNRTVLLRDRHRRADGEQLYGQGGAEFRLRDPSFLLVDPFVTVTYNHQFDRAPGVIGSYLAFLPTQTLTGTAYAPNLDFVKVAVGSTFELGPRWYGTVTAFGLKGANNLAAGGGNLGLAHRF